MPTSNATTPRVRRRGRAEAVLDRAEARAKERLVRHAQGFEGELKSAFAEGGLIRRHPYVAIAGAAALGTLAVPLLLRVLRSPGPALRTARKIARGIGIPLPAWTAMTFVRGVTENRRSPDVDGAA